MKNTKISDFWFYKFRYQITYTILFISYISIILYTLFVAPNGLTQAEMDSAQASFNFSHGPLFSTSIIDAPYKLLQKISIMVFGLSHFSIKLPSILLSLLSIAGIIKLTHKWFSRGIATLVSIIALTSSQFFFLAQNGTPEILYILYPIAILFIGASFISCEKKFPYAIIMAAVAGVSLYTPFSIYILLALLATAMTHPHLRFMVKKIPRNYLSSGVALFLVIILPLLVAIFREPEIIKSLLGWPETLNLAENIKLLTAQLFGSTNASSRGIVSPIIDPASIILIGTGFFFTLSSSWSARSYSINIWSIILIAICIANPSAITILFTPILILTVSGLQSLIHTWYTIFPKNPYARVAGLVPVFVIVVGLLLTNLDSFRLSYLYSPEVVNNFSQDLILIQDISEPRDSLIVSEKEFGFYSILDQKVEIFNNTDSKLLVSNKAFVDYKNNNKYEIKKIFTSNRNQDGDRFYLLERI
jgi:4-amino-4-deoxy-L-arabinose transferase-like glycosyltransferase